MSPAFDLSGRGVGLAGGSGHLGRAIAFELARAGAHVVLFGRGASDLGAVVKAAAAMGLPGRLVSTKGDVHLEADLDRVLDMVEKEAGRVHGWVNAAYRGPTGPLLESPPKFADLIVTAGLNDQILAARKAAERMVPHRSGSIVNVASAFASGGVRPDAWPRRDDLHDSPSYAAAKAGVIGFTRSAACELARHGIRVNSVSPGAFPSGEPDEERDRALAARVPLGRLGQPKEIAGAVLFLLSDAAAYITGQDLVIDGGLTLG